MRVLTLLTLIFVHQTIFAQYFYEAYVCDKTTKLPLEYVNIGIKNLNKGTVTNSKGYFAFSFSEKHLNHKLMFSYFGYDTKTYNISQLIANTPDTIWLLPKAQEYEEHVVTSMKGKWKLKKRGLTRNLPGVYGIVESDTIADIGECAQRIDLDSTLTKITKFFIYLKSVKTDTAAFRINFYHLENDLPGERAFEKEILIRRPIKDGWMEIDLNDYNIWLSNEIVASIELLPPNKPKDRVRLFYGGIIICKGISYNRTSSHGEWGKLDFGTYAIYLETKQFKKK